MSRRKFGIVNFGGKCLKRIIGVSAVAVIITTIGLGMNADRCKAEKVETSGGELSMNIGLQDYERNTSPVTSYLMTNADGTISRVEGREDPNHVTGAGYILIENYDSSFAYKSFKKIVMELSYFGGFYSGSEYNYIVLGQQNPFENNSIEVIRVIKYTKNWERVSSCSLSGINTIAPFAYGSCRMCELDGRLYIRTSHRMYKTQDGNNHQANLTFVIDEASMKTVDSQYAVGSTPNGYVSHSFNQFMLSFRNNIYAVDHGDAYPRAIMTGVYKPVVAADGTIKSSWTTSNLIDISGIIGNNITGASIGGFEASGARLLVAGNIVNQDENAAINKVRNVYVASENFDMTSFKNTSYLTKYKEDSLYSASTPQLVKISDDYFLLMWEVKQRAAAGLNFSRSGLINYVFLNGEGKAASETFSVQGSLSDCKPVLYNNKAVWYVTDTSSPEFYTLKINGQKEDPAKVGTIFKSGDYSYKITKSTSTRFEVAVCGLSDINSAITKAVIPNTVSYNGYEYKVTSIYARAFKNNATIKSVVLNTYLKVIDKYAFYGCNVLKKITLSNNVSTIKSKAFYKCSKLVTVTINGKKLKSLNSKCFSKINSKAVFKCKKSKIKAYTKLFKSKTGYLKKSMKLKAL